jgi:hypothetical protein
VAPVRLCDGIERLQAHQLDGHGTRLNVVAPYSTAHVCDAAASVRARPLRWCADGVLFTTLPR